MGKKSKSSRKSRSSVASSSSASWWPGPASQDAAPSFSYYNQSNDDEAYEFQAPKYHDFTKDDGENHEVAESWFETHADSPSQVDDEEDGSYDFDFSSEIESSVDMETPKPKKRKSFRRNSIIVAPLNLDIESVTQSISVAADTQASLAAEHVDDFEQENNTGAQEDPNVVTNDDDNGNADDGISEIKHDLENSLQQIYDQMLEKPVASTDNIFVYNPRISDYNPLLHTQQSSKTVTFANDSDSESENDETDEHYQYVEETTAAKGRKAQKRTKKRVQPPRLTVPKEFNFSKRPERKRPLLSVKSPRIKKKQRRTVRKRTNNVSLTIPKPFNFHTTTRRMEKESDAPPSPYVPLVLRVKQFDKTPDRFKPNIRANKLRQEYRSQELTRPRSPFLRTRYRNKPHQVPSTEELELKEVQSFEQFKAKPLIRKIFEKPVGVPEVKRPPLTIPMSPAIHKPRPMPPPEPSPPRIIKANPIMIPETYKLPKVEKKHPTVPQPFSLPGEFYSEQKKREFEAHVRRMMDEEEKARHFHAQPLPDLDEPNPLPKVETKPITVPKPFALKTDIRGDSYQKQLAEHLLKEQVEKENATKFHARPLPDPVPFVPKKSDKPLTDHGDIVLHTNMRAEERKLFDEFLEEKRKADQELREYVRRQKEAEEQQRLKQIRKQLVHKAQPVRSFAPVVIKTSSKPLTHPQSPMIGKKRKNIAMNVGKKERRGRSKLREMNMSGMDNE
ncbi:hypothetical protein BKA69DRAFT_920618 [Paraphysoderma sedebokerense]|nr:hypothetical protein BKA69DRAFT_920618 [Paraphysoderma sedebokerense]